MAIIIDKIEPQASLCENEKSQKVEKMKADIQSICRLISLPSNKFKAKESFNEIKNYVQNYDRLLYAEISTYCYNLESENKNSFQGNLNSLIEYVFSRDYENGLKAESGNKKQDEIELRERTKRVVIKLYDNVNLACAQMDSLRQSKDDLHEHFVSEFEPVKAEITKDISSQLITLVGIFTAIAFLVFGGFSSLTDVFAHIGDNIARTIMLVSIWGLIICNGIFVFLGCIEKIVQKESVTELLNKNNIFKWTNYILVFIFISSLWTSIVDKYDLGQTIIEFCQRKYVSIVGFIVIFIAFGIIGYFIFKHKRK